MAVQTYGDYDNRPASDDRQATTAGGKAGMVFLWLAWAAAAVFWGFVLSTGVGILQSGSPEAAQPGGGADVGGVSWLVIDVIGVVLLGLALAWGMARWAWRNKTKDPMTEAATRAEYDLIEAHGGDEEITRSPEARRPEERDAYRAINPGTN